MVTIKRFILIFLGFLICSAAAFVQAEEKNFLPIEKAFVLNAKYDSNKKEAVFNFQIAKNYHLYKEHLKIKTLEGTELAENAYTLPSGIIKKDDLGQYEVFKHTLDIALPFTQTEQNKGFQIEYQGCAEEGFCYPPQTKKITFSNTGQATITEMSFEDTAVQATSSNAPAATQSESDLIAGFFTQKSLPLTLLAFLGFGVLLAFTPCVLPMIPILANIIVGQTSPTRGKSIFLACLYVLSMALCYALAGLAAGLLGSQLQAALQQPHYLLTLAFVIILFALSQMSLIRVEFPSFITDFFQKFGNRQMQGGTVISTVTMGIVSALMVSPCVTPALVGSLTYIGQTGDALLGGFALFALALGMGAPLLIVASIGSHLLPKAGHWMVYVKNATGVLLLVLAGSIFMRAIPNQAATQQINLASQFTSVQTPTELTSALNIAREKNKYVILDVYADWCVSCRQMDKEIFENQLILNNLKSKDVSLLRLDLTHPTPAVQALKKQLDIIGPPMVLFFGPDGQEIRAFRAAGKIETNHFLERINSLNKTATN